MISKVQLHTYETTTLCPSKMRNTSIQYFRKRYFQLHNALYIMTMIIVFSLSCWKLRICQLPDAKLITPPHLGTGSCSFMSATVYWESNCTMVIICSRLNFVVCSYSITFAFIVCMHAVYIWHQQCVALLIRNVKWKQYIYHEFI